MPLREWNEDEEVNPEYLRGLLTQEFEVPDIVGHVEGWRAWNVDREPPAFGTTPKLYSATYGYYWTPRVRARAECNRGGDDHVPGEQCSCGFYAAKTLPHLRSMGYSSYHEEGPQVTIVGQLAMWGKVIEGTQGWRSEYAYPVKLFVPFEAWRLAKPVAKAYGVPVELLNLLDPEAMPGDGKVVKPS